MNKFGDNTDMYVGTLAADEDVYAGGKIYSSVTNDNIYYYLKIKINKAINYHILRYLQMYLLITLIVYLL